MIERAKCFSCAALTAGILCLLSACVGIRSERTAMPFRSPLNVVVMDPLSANLACACIPGFAQRDYGRLATFLEKRLKRPVRVVVAESLQEAAREALGANPVHLAIGKYSVVSRDARRTGVSMHPIAMLADAQGRVSFHGVFIVRRDDPAKRIEDLEKRSVLFGPAEAIEKHAAALAELEVRGVQPGRSATSSACGAAAVAVLEKEADAAVISSYAVRLLVGCGAVKKNELRAIGKTGEVPFIAVFASTALSSAETAAVRAALRAANGSRGVLRALESRDGFVPIADAGPADPWPDWRGPKRDGRSPFVPKRIGRRPVLLWRHPMTGLGLAGVTVSRRHVIVADKSLDAERDVFRCLDAFTGVEVWRLSYPAPKEMDYSNSPRAQPVVRDGLVYLLGAFGDLHCVRESDGEVVWRCNILDKFGAALPTWGTCATPLIVGDRLIVNPGAPEASLAALDKTTGRVLWTTPGNPPGYGSFIVGTFGGRRQIVGHDAVSLGGWNPETGKRLWKLTPPVEGDFNVPTPIDVNGRLLVVSENNGARLYGFGRDGRIRPQPVAVNSALAPDTLTPVLANGLVLGNSNKLLCLDPGNGLRTCWTAGGNEYADYCTYLAGKENVLVTTLAGELRLVRVRKDKFTCVSEVKLFNDGLSDREVWSHPALAGNRLYVRDQAAVSCFLLRP
ncbi:MAG: PhnD/SsuA/transferrin family substrate-binding protein [Kiritimatiellaeota bacterium]|nr:PhnD/SsuA/transferrin family substrate-binding protein [Kiritimatiellota bacterium]